jgi:hypothetical protein
MANAKFQPQPQPGYVGMLVLIAASMFLGIICMALEANEYGWDPKPKPTDKISLPSPSLKAHIEPMIPRDTATVQAPTPTAPKAVETPMPVPTLPDVRVPVPPAVASKPEEKKDLPKGPVPSPLLFPKRDETNPTTNPKEQPKSETPTTPAPSPLKLGQPKG